MRLIHPSPGELLDRKTILHLKIEAGRRRPVSVAHFEEELKMIEAARELADVNRKLWDAEDEVRELPRSAQERLAELAKWIPELNDRRADLVQRVNRLFAVSQTEKLYP